MNRIDLFFERHGRWLLWGLFLALAGSLFFRLGLQPLYQEEPRRALIALEMLFRKNLVVPTEFGEIYQRKPPLWNWMILGAFRLFGNQSEFAVRFFSTFSFLLTGFLVYLAGKKYVSRAFGLLAAILFLVSVDIYFYFSLLGEIDLFYSFLVFAGFLAMFHYHEQGKPLLMFLAVYLFTALGFLTKGFPSIVFTGLSLPVFLYYRRDFRKLFGIRHLAGIVFFLLIVGGYFLAYSRHADPLRFLEVMWSGSSRRTLLDAPQTPLWQHLPLFPLIMLKNLLPASLLLVWLFRKDLLPRLRENALVLFAAVIFTANVWVYWISPGTRDRYVYMLYPLLVMVFSWFYLSADPARWQRLFLKVAGNLFLVILAAAAAALPFLAQTRSLEGIRIVSVLAFPVLLLLLVLFNRSRKYFLYILAAALVVTRWVFAFTVIPLRSAGGDAAENKTLARSLALQTAGEPVFLLGETTVPRTLVFYLEREKQQVVSRADSMQTPAYYFAAQGQAVPAGADSIFGFRDHKNLAFILFRFPGDGSAPDELP